MKSFIFRLYKSGPSCHASQGERWCIQTRGESQDPNPPIPLRGREAISDSTNVQIVQIFLEWYARHSQKEEEVGVSLPRGVKSSCPPAQQPKWSERPGGGCGKPQAISQPTGLIHGWIAL